MFNKINQQKSAYYLLVPGNLRVVVARNMHLHVCSLNCNGNY